MTSHITKGWLYGHYDSRGGATLVYAPNREEADRIYASVFMHHSGIFDTKEEADEADKQVCEEDFIAPAIVMSHRPLEHNEDLENSCPNPPAWEPHDPHEWAVLWCPKEEADPWNSLPEGGDIHFILTNEWARDDNPPVKGWVPSQFGEDAYGVIFMNKEHEQ